MKSKYRIKLKLDEYNAYTHVYEVQKRYFFFFWIREDIYFDEHHARMRVNMLKYRDEFKGKVIEID